MNLVLGSCHRFARYMDQKKSHFVLLPAFRFPGLPPCCAYMHVSLTVCDPLLKGHLSNQESSHLKNSHISF